MWGVEEGEAGKNDEHSLGQDAHPKQLLIY